MTSCLCNRERMDFAEKQLLKCGWVRGDGLGKSVKGLAEPIKVRLKRDCAGVGSEAASEFTSHWWNKVFNQAAKNINVLEDEEGGVVAVKAYADTSSERKKRHYGNHRKELCYGGFLSSSNSYLGSPQDNPKGGEEDNPKGGEEDGERSTADGGGGEEETDRGDKSLFEACGGRTAHKAARHGCKLSGKLQRLHDQERAGLQQEEVAAGGGKLKRRRDQERTEPQWKESITSGEKNKKRQKKRQKLNKYDLRTH